MIGTRLYPVFAVPLGWKPQPSACNDYVGRIQQTINGGFKTKRFGDPNDAGTKAAMIADVMPLTVDGRAGGKTIQALFAVLPEYETQFGPETSLRQLQSKYGTPSEPPFSCAKPPGPEGPGFWAGLPPWAPAAAVAVAAVGLAAKVAA